MREAFTSKSPQDMKEFPPSATVNATTGSKVGFGPRVTARRIKLSLPMKLQIHKTFQTKINGPTAGVIRVSQLTNISYAPW